MVFNFSTCKMNTSNLFSVYIIQISYGAQDPSLVDSDRYPYFYATVPTDKFLNRVRAELLKDFQWKRVALITIDELDYITVS